MTSLARLAPLAINSQQPIQPLFAAATVFLPYSLAPGGHIVSVSPASWGNAAAHSRLRDKDTHHGPWAV